MTKFESTVPRLKPAPATPPTIYRDTPLPDFYPATARPAVAGTYLPTRVDERISNAVLLGLAATLVPAVWYCLAQMMSLVASGSLDRAIQAFVR